MPILRFFDGVTWVGIDSNDAKTLNGKTDLDFVPISHIGATVADDGSLAHPISTEEDPGFMSPEDRIKLDQLRTQHIFVSDVRPVNPFEGMVWHKITTNDHYLYVNGDFHYISGDTLDAEMARMKANIIDIGIEVELLKRAELRGVNANIFLETFQSIDDVKLTKGTYDSTNHRITL